MSLTRFTESDFVGTEAAAVAGRSLNGAPFKDVSSATLRQALTDDTTSDTLRSAIKQELVLREDEHRRALNDYDMRQFAYRDPHANPPDA